MRKRIKAVVWMVIFVLLMGQTVIAREPEETEIYDVAFEVFGLEEESVYQKYAELFNGADVILHVEGRDLTYLKLLRRFHFRSLELVVTFEDASAYDNMKFINDLLFPECLTRVTVTAGREEPLRLNDAANNFIIALWVCCPDAVLNDVPVSEWASGIRKADSYELASLYETNAKLHYLFELTQRGRLELLPGDPSFSGKMLFLVYGDGELSSQEAVLNGESFYSVPGSYLASDFDSADMAIFIFPVSSLVGRYSNGGDALAMFTRVSVVDLHSLNMYETYTAVRNDPPDSLDIYEENGVYSTDGAEGAYEPQTAVNQILGSKYQAQYSGAEEDLAYQASLLPWIEIPETVEEETGENAAADGEFVAGEALSADAVTETPVIPGVNEETIEEMTAENAAEDPADVAQEHVSEVEESVPGTAAAQDKETETTTSAAQTTYIDQSVYPWLTEERLYEIFAGLGSEEYQKTYENLKKVKDLEYGSTGEAALGLQKTLIAFGCSIAADSSIGNATIGALNTVQAAFKLGKTSKISSKTYALLMPALLISTEEETAGELLSDVLSEDGREFLYLRGSAFYARGAYYSAREAFIESEYDDWEARALSCIQDMPATGQVYRNAELTGSETSLSIHVNSADELTVTCVKIYTKDDVLAAVLLVRGNGDASASLPQGGYRVIDGNGYRWYGIDEMFGSDGSYEVMIFDDGTDILNLRSGYDYKLTFNVIEHNDAAQNVGAQMLDWDMLKDDK